MNMRRTALKTIAGLAATGLSAPFARAAGTHAYPSRPIRVVTPFPAGSGPDVLLRALGEPLGQALSHPVLVDNKPGGNGLVAVGAWRQGSTDGHDLIQLDSNQITTHPHTYSKLPYKVEDDFVPLSQITLASFFIAVAADSPYRSVEELFAAAKARPGAINYGSPFIGSPGHIATLRLEAMKGLRMTHIPFRDFGALHAAVSTKEVDWALGTAASAGPLQRSGRLRFLALAASKRDPLYPDVPATAELASLRGFEVSGWTGIFGPKAMPAAARDRVISELAKVMAKTEVLERYRALSVEVPKLTGAAFNELILRETRSWGDVIRSTNIKLD